MFKRYLCSQQPAAARPPHAGRHGPTAAEARCSNASGMSKGLGAREPAWPGGQSGSEAGRGDREQATGAFPRQRCSSALTALAIKRLLHIVSRTCKEKCKHGRKNESLSLSLTLFLLPCVYPLLWDWVLLTGLLHCICGTCRALLVWFSVCCQLYE